jgi:hypothetical protein
MSGLAEVLAGQTIVKEKSETVAEAATTSNAVSFEADSMQDEQVRTLAEQLFFRSKGPQCRHVGFTAADPQNDIARLCLNVARVVAGDKRHDVALIDAGLRSAPLELQIGKQREVPEGPWEFEARLWLVPRDAWLEDDDRPGVGASSLLRLRELTMQFDFSILCCGPMSWLAARVGRACEGLVLVLTANQTRRLVAENMRDQLRAAGIPLLGTVLSARRFPVPTPLYRKL